MFEIGEYIVNPHVGVCLVQDILHLDISGADRKKLYYLLLPVEHTSEKLYMPTDSTDPYIRRVMSAEEAAGLLERFHEIPERSIENEKLREQIYKDALKKGDPEELLSIIKQLYLKKQNREKKGKRGTATDEQYFRKVENRLYHELAISLHKDISEVYPMIKEIAEKS